MTFYGPPPRRPVEPFYASTTHVLHLILCFFTFGLWAFVWLIVTIANNNANNAKRARYAQALAQYESDWWAWSQAQQQQSGQPVAWVRFPGQF